MAYQIKRSKTFSDTLELCGDSDAVEKTLNINIDIDAISRDFRKLMVSLTDAEKKLKQSQETGRIEAFDSAYTAYGEAVINLFEVTLGKQNTAEILAFYEGRYTEMSVQIFPYITDVIIPKISEAVKQKKKELKKIRRR